MRIIQVTGQIFFRDNKNIPRHILIGIFEEYDGSFFLSPPTIFDPNRNDPLSVPGIFTLFSSGLPLMCNGLTRPDLKCQRVALLNLVRIAELIKIRLE